MKFSIKDNTISIYNYDDEILKNITNDIKHISIQDCVFNSKLDNLPLHIEKLWIDTNYQDPFEHELNFLPSNLNELSIMCEYNKPLDDLPPNLQTLFIHSSIFNQRIDNFPKKLKYLAILSGDFSYDIDLNNFPCLEKLYVHCGLLKFIKNYNGKVKIGTDADDMCDIEYQYLLNS